jgi:RNA 3'-terminal phosphate cyclase
VQLLNDSLLGTGTTTVKGAEIGSTELQFDPSGSLVMQQPNDAEARTVRFQVEINTAGSVMLLIQAVLPAALLANFILKRHNRVPNIDAVHVEFIGGGTHVDFAPTSDYFRHVFLPFMLNQFHLEEDAITLLVDRW